MILNDPPAILWDDPHLIAVDKPAGLLTQGTPGGEPTLEDAVRRLVRPDDPGSVYLGTVHRLDRPVSGVVVWAKTPKAARRLAEAFARREMKKTYWAVVEGPPVAVETTWQDAIGPVSPAGAATIDPVRGKPARTNVATLDGARVGPGLSALVLRPETGRTHQIRVQTSSRGRPIVGDASYGATRPFPSGIALHARGLIVTHPMSGRAISIVAPLPESWSTSGFDFVEAVRVRRS